MMRKHRLANVAAIVFVIAPSDLGQFRIFCAEDDPGGQIFRRARVFSPDNPVCRIFCAYYAANGKAYTILPNVAGKHQRFVRLQNRSQMDLVE